MSWLERLFNKKGKKSAQIAKDRLICTIAIDRDNALYIDQMKRDIVSVLRRYIEISDIQIKKESREDNLELIEIDIFIKKSL